MCPRLQPYVPQAATLCTPGIATAATNEMMQLQFNVAGGCPGVRPCASPVPEPEPDPSPKALTLTPALSLTLATHPDHGPWPHSGSAST